MWPRDDVLSSLLATASKQHTPIAPSPLNPTLCESDLILGRHIYQLRKTARPQVTRRPPEISPRLRFLKRKAYFEYQAHPEAHCRHHHHSIRAGCGDGTAVVLVAEGEERCIRSAADCEGGEQEDDGNSEYTPAAFIVESGSLFHVVQYGCAQRHGLAADVEKQTRLGVPRPSPRWQSPQRVQFVLVLCLMSACLTFLTVVSLSMLRADRDHPV